MGNNAAVKWWGLHGYDHPVGSYGLCASSRHNPTPKQQWLGSAWVKMSVCGTHATLIYPWLGNCVWMLTQKVVPVAVVM